MWWPIIANMRDFFRKTLEGVAIEAGIGADVKAYPAIFLSWDESESQLHGRAGGKCVLFIDEYVQNHDPDPAAGYAKLYELQEQRKKALMAWWKENDLPLAITIAGQKTVSDNGMFMPEYGSRTMLQIEWKV
jgi:hypothetical protein